MLSHFTFAKFRFTIKAVEEMVYRHTKALCSGEVLDMPLKRLYVYKEPGKSVRMFASKNLCLQLHFETFSPEDTKVLRLYVTIPHPCHRAAA